VRWVEKTDRKGTVRLLADGVCVGVVFPVVTMRPDGEWFGKVTGKPARRCAGRDEAVAYVKGES